ncbi:DUF4038 domain-containing protein [Phragmitibacter flavus]|uniref:DUF4038 domain-containing protein n=1 Tax=Phragmitibacter flavus TaxID=2576071 RepID=A0A5R8KEB0_9BACT|nr:DUF4038 domain-containing protein [Phragmitibacter flavus]
MSENQRFLTTENGDPFFYLGDTAWELFHRLNREEADHYLTDRAQKGFTVIQAVALAELDGLNTPNAYGHRPFLNNDPTQPDLKDGPNNDYWDHVDHIIKKANTLGLRVGFLPTWGDKWNLSKGAGPEIFTPANANLYGRWLGERYKKHGLIWIVGGDRTVDNETHREIIRAMALGLRAGDDGQHLITFHPRGGQGSIDIFPDESWLDFHMRQNGHDAEYNPRYTTLLADYDKKPIKPTLDGEPLYEDHPIAFKADMFGHSISADVRRPLYWNLFAGACGHTYGHHSVWQMWTPSRKPVNNPLMSWPDALQQPGAAQMQHAKNLLLSRPYFTRIPDEKTVLVESPVKSAMPGTGRYHFSATRDLEGRYAMVYAPAGRSFKVSLTVIKNAPVKAWWFDPRDGSSQLIGEFPNTGQGEFTPPNPGEHLDWVLVLDDASQNFPAPGTVP